MSLPPFEPGRLFADAGYRRLAEAAFGSVAAGTGRPLEEALGPRTVEAQVLLAAFAGSTQGLSPLLARLPDRAVLPEELAAFLVGEAEASTKRAARLRERLGVVSRALGDEGIRVVALKGAALAFRDDADPSLRPMGDLDLLLADPRDLPRATRLLRASAGLVPLFDTPRHRVFAEPDERVVRPATEDPGNPIRVELHVAFRLPILGRVYDATDQLISGAVPFDAVDGGLLAPSREAMLRHLLLHAAEDAAAGGLRGIQAWDFRVLSGRDGPLAPKLPATEAGAAAGPLLFAVDHVERLTPGTFSPGFIEALASNVRPATRARAAALPPLRHTRPSRGRTRVLLSLIDRPSAKVRFALRTLFPSPGELRANVAEGATGPRLALAYGRVLVRRFRTPITLALPLLAAVLILAPRLGWGLATPAPESLVAKTCEPDERSVIEAVLRTGLRPLNPGTTHWGGLSAPLLASVLAAGDAAGAFSGGAREALRSGDAARAGPVVVAMRAVSLVAALALVAATWALGRRTSPRAAFLAASLAAVSPAVALYGRTLMPDVLAAALLALSFLPAGGFAAGLLGGLACGAKYASAAYVPALVISVARGERGRAAAGLAVGFLAGAPGAVASPMRTLHGLLGAAADVRVEAPGNFAPFGLWGSHLVGLVFFVVGPVALVLAVSGLARAGLRQSRNVATLAFFSGAALWLVVAHFPVVRYFLPLVPMVAVLAANAAERLAPSGRRGALVAVALLAPPAGLSVLFTLGVPVVHPFESARGALLRAVPEGSPAPVVSVATVWDGMPSLPGPPRLSRQPLRPFSLDGRAVPGPAADFLIEDDLSTLPYAASYVAARARIYVPLGSWGGPPRLLGLTWPRGLTPHDMRYPSPRVTLFGRAGREPAAR